MKSTCYGIEIIFIGTDYDISLDSKYAVEQIPIDLFYFIYQSFEIMSTIP